jgi:hypothetical protein
MKTSSQQSAVGTQHSVRVATWYWTDILASQVRVSFPCCRPSSRIMNFLQFLRTLSESAEDPKIRQSEAPLH